MGKKNIGGIIPTTPTQSELESWNLLFDTYLWLDPIKDKGREPGRMCYCTRCRKVYRVDEWARVQTYEDRQILTATQASEVTCAKCGMVAEARFVNVSRRKASQGEYVAVIRANGYDEILIDGYFLWKDYGKAKDGCTLQFTALPRWRKCERYVLRPGTCTKYVRSYGYSRSNNDEDLANWSMDSYGDNILDMFLSYKWSMAQRYEPFTLYGEHNLCGTFLKYNALKEWERGAHQQKVVRYLSLLCLYPGLETLLKAGYLDIVKTIVFDKLKFYGRVDLNGKGPQDILGEGREACRLLKGSKNQSLMLKAHKHHHKDVEWSIKDISDLEQTNDHWYVLNDQLCFCNEHKISPRALLRYLKRQHQLRLKQYEQAIHENGCLARHGAVAPRFHDEWIHLRDWRVMYGGEMGVPPRELFPKDVAAAHEAILNVRNERVEREIQDERAARGHTLQTVMEAKRKNWEQQTKNKYTNAARIDGSEEKCGRMDKRLRWRIKHLSFSEGRYMTVIPQRTRELVAEGEALHHCVGTYCDSYAASMTNIVFIRDREHLDQPLLTVEIDNNGHVKQCYGFGDDMTYTKDSIWMDPEYDKYMAVYDKAVREFAEHYKAYLKKHFEEMQETKQKKVRTTA